MRLSKRERTVLKVGMPFVAAILLYFLVMDPLLDEQREMKSQLEAKAVLLNKYHKALSQRKILEEQYQQLQSQLVLLEGKLLRGDKPPLAAAELQKLLKSAAEKANVSIASERILEPMVKGHYLEIPVEINVKSTMSRLTTLIYEIENSPRYLSISELNIRADHKVSPQEMNATLVVTGLIRNPGTI